MGNYELRYLRDKQKYQVDFLVVRDRQPWFLAEIKLADHPRSATSKPRPRHPTRSKS